MKPKTIHKVPTVSDADMLERARLFCSFSCVVEDYCYDGNLYRCANGSETFIQCEIESFANERWVCPVCGHDNDAQKTMVAIQRDDDVGFYD